MGNPRRAQKQINQPESSDKTNKSKVPLADSTNKMPPKEITVKEKPPDNKFIMQIMSKEANRMAQMNKEQAAEALGGTLVRLGGL